MKSVNALLSALIVELVEGDIPHPLRQEFPIYAVWSDLCRLAGEPVPAAVLALLDAPAVACLPVVPDAFRAALAEPVRVAEYEPA